MKDKKFKTGLVLNGGVTRAFFQLGFAETLCSIVEIDCFVGTGLGALFSAGLASGIKPSVLIKNALSLVPEDFTVAETEDNWSFFSNRAIIDKVNGGELVEEFSHFKNKVIFVGTDLEMNEQVIINRGNVRSAVEAAMAFPCFNRAGVIGGKYIVSGDLVNPFPVDIAWSGGADRIIAVDTVSQHLRDFDESNVPMTPYIEKASIAFPQLWLLHKKKVPWLEMRVFEASLTDAIDDYMEIRRPCLTIKLEEEAPELARRTYMDSFDKIPELIAAGQAAGEKYANEIDTFLST